MPLIIYIGRYRSSKTEGCLLVTKLWGGRFTQETDKLVECYNASIGFDRQLALYDIAGSRAHVRMLARQGILTAEEAETILSGLQQIESEIRAGDFVFRQDQEDIHMNIEHHLMELVGPVGGKLHTGRSRNDQVALDMRLYVRDAIDRIQSAIHVFQVALVEQAEQTIDVILPGYTHLQRAQPVRLAHHLLAYFEMLKRDRARLADCRARLNLNPLGAGALAGTTFPLDRHQVAEELDFSGVTANSLDTVGDRDFVLEFLAAASILMMHLSRLSEELILWSSQEFGFVELADGYCTGSSIMPQKKNPDVLELVRGKTGRVYGHLVQLLTVMKGLPLAYNKDMQEDKEGLFDTVDTLETTLLVLAGLLRNITWKEARMREACEQGFVNATDVADYLVGKGIPFREAHAIVGKAVLICVERNCTLEDLTLEEWRNISPEIDSDITSVLQIENVVEARQTYGGTARKQVEQQLQEAREYLQSRDP